MHMHISQHACIPRNVDPYLYADYQIFRYTCCYTSKRVTSLAGRAVGNAVSDLTGLRFKPQTSRSRDDRITARPTGRCKLFVIYEILFLTSVVSEFWLALS